MKGVVGDEELELGVAALALGELGHELAAVFGDKEGGEADNVEVLLVDARHAGREEKVWRLGGPLGLGRLLGCLAGASSSNVGAAAGANLGQAPLVVIVVGVAWAEEAKLVVGLLLIADALLKGDAVAGDVAGRLFENVANLAGREDDAGGGFHVIEDGGRVAVGAIGGHGEDR